MINMYTLTYVDRKKERRKRKENFRLNLDGSAIYQRQFIN